MTDTPPVEPPSSIDASPTPAPLPPPPPDEGFSTVEKIAGAAVAYKAPFTSSLIASALLRDETDPTRRRQLALFRKVSIVWWGVGAVVTLVGIIAVLSIWSSTAASGSCQGGADKYDPASTTYQSRDDQHWTATYPCMDGGSTTVPVPRRLVPGAQP